MERSMYIRLDTLDKIRHFTNEVSGMNGRFYLSSGRYVVSAGSILGIMSLNLLNPLKLEACSDKEEFDRLKKYEAS